MIRTLLAHITTRQLVHDVFLIALLCAAILVIVLVVRELRRQRYEEILEAGEHAISDAFPLRERHRPDAQRGDRP